MHIAFIPDGMRRWAMLHEASYAEAYLRMAERLRDYVELSFSNGARVVSLFLSSRQNFHRTEEDIEAFCSAEEVLCSLLLPVVANRFAVRVLSVGNMHLLPEYLLKAARRLAEETKQNDNGRLYLCFGYDPLDEVHSAIQKHHHKTDLFSSLWIPEYVDIVMRTGQGSVASSFLPLQCAGHAKIYALDKLFLDSTPAELINILSIHQKDNATRSVESVEDLIAAQTPPRKDVAS